MTPTHSHRALAIHGEKLIVPAPDGVCLTGVLCAPPAAAALVILAHSRSSTCDSEHQKIAQVLNDAGFATLTLDFLNESEARYAREIFDVDVHADRLRAALLLVRDRFEHVGCFATGTASAAALQAAARQPGGFEALVSVRGQPDGARFWLAQVHTPTLLIAGRGDEAEHNRAAYMSLPGRKALCVVPMAANVFEDAAGIVQRRTIRWFSAYLRGAAEAVGTRGGAGAGRQATPAVLHEFG